MTRPWRPLGAATKVATPPPVAGLNGISIPVRENLDIVEAGRLAASAYALDPDFVSGMKRDAGDHAPGGCGSVHSPKCQVGLAPGKQGHRGSPLIDHLVRHPQPKLRDAVDLVDVLDMQCTPPRRTLVTQARRALRNGAGDGFSTGSVLPGGDVPNRVPLQVHRLRLEAVRVVAHPA